MRLQASVENVLRRATNRDDLGEPNTQAGAVRADYASDRRPKGLIVAKHSQGQPVWQPPPQPAQVPPQRPPVPARQPVPQQQVAPPQQWQPPQQPGPAPLPPSQSYPPPPQQQALYGPPPTKAPRPANRGRTNKILLSITGAAVLIIVVVAVATSLGGGGGSSPTPAPTKVLITQSGTGNSVTDNFTVAGNYAITYTYDCSKASNSNGNFIVYSYGATNNVVPINEVFSPGGQGTETVESRPGTYHLTINSECSWSISVKG